mmetsp:Transcript_7499/g.23242  ORF Transcript_7499/g.23242 Transcript_7499/m.23242 type:complete len:86 (+) Transcript_7499:1231-1488(+)
MGQVLCLKARSFVPYPRMRQCRADHRWMVIGGAWEWHRPCTLRLFASTGSVIHPFVLIELSSGDRGLRSLFRPADVGWLHFLLVR